MTDGKGRNPGNLRTTALLFSGLLVTLTIPLPGLAEDASGSGGPLGFPSGSTLRSIVAGEAAPGKSLPGKPLGPDFGPREWSQEGGSQTRNPFFAAPTGRKNPSPSPPLSPPPLPGEEDRRISPSSQTSVSPVEWERNFGTTPLVGLDYRFAHQPVLVGGATPSHLDPGPGSLS